MLTFKDLIERLDVTFSEGFYRLICDYTKHSDGVRTAEYVLFHQQPGAVMMESIRARGWKTFMAQLEDTLWLPESSDTGGYQDVQPAIEAFEESDADTFPVDPKADPAA